MSCDARPIQKPYLPLFFGGSSEVALVMGASRGDVHDERLWMPVAALAGGRGNSSCLVGTPQQVAEAMLKYYRMGVHSFLIRGFDPVNDVSEYGRELIPRLKLGAQEIDAQAQAPAS